MSTVKSAGKHRPYRGPEDSARRHVVVCQGPPEKAYLRICELDTEKTGRHRFAGGWHDVYRCARGHRFGVKTTDSGRTVVDIPTGPVVFGE